MRLLSPLSTLPGPHSTVVAIPCDTMYCTQAVHCTGLKICSNRMALIFSGSASGLALTLCTTGICGALNLSTAIASFSLSPAGRINDVWKGVLTGRGIADLRHTAFSLSIARFTDATLPTITDCCGELT